MLEIADKILWNLEYNSLKYVIVKSEADCVVLDTRRDQSAVSDSLRFDCKRINCIWADKKFDGDLITECIRGFFKEERNACIAA